jgi:hypothetical protein
MWLHFATGFTGSTTTLSPGSPYAASTLSFHSQDTIEAELRVQRNF